MIYASEFQEPLLPLNTKGTTGSTHLRSGVSPTCPRHGRAALLAAAAAARPSLQGSGQGTGPALEEIQV